MNEHPYSFGRNGAVATAESRNRVLRNVYWLLALSMVPTVGGMPLEFSKRSWASLPTWSLVSPSVKMAR